MGGSSTASNSSTCGQCPGLELLYEQSRLPLVTVYSAVFVLALPANGLAAGLALLAARRGNVLAVYIFCLALCELLYVGTLPLWALYIQNKHRWALARRTCRLTAFVFFCNMYASILLLCCMACDRALALAHPLASRARRRPLTAALVCTVVLVLVGVVHGQVLVGLPEVGRNDTCFDELPIDATTAGYYYARFALGFAVPLGVLAAATWSIRRSVQRSLGLSAACKARARRLAAAVLLLFLGCFAPYHVVLLLRAAAYSYYHDCCPTLCAFEKRLYTAFVAFLCLCTVSSVADPVLYVLVSDHLRQEAGRLRGCWWLTSRGTEVTQLTGSKDLEEPRSPGAPSGGQLCPLDSLYEDI
ncbi:probable G-protein coupled receptor 132 [Erinaceus europaeus]|uniref:Probable G-protein coupled receptor 132 n=1 Tax=Erinaceus europaeus TaxID=9365 RepID=A0ABM3WJZ7_ERIEU|nr:probable G-protein coupled receptor 132 [Erinaceus europaeus]